MSDGPWSLVQWSLDLLLCCCLCLHLPALALVLCCLGLQHAALAMVSCCLVMHLAALVCGCPDASTTLHLPSAEIALALVLN